VTHAAIVHELRRRRRKKRAGRGLAATSFMMARNLRKGRTVPVVIGLVCALAAGCAGGVAPVALGTDGAAGSDASNGAAGSDASDVAADRDDAADAGIDATDAGRTDAALRPVVKVMTFNLRHGDAPDGEDAWELRKPLAFDVFNRHEADFVGTQEGVDSQLVDIDRAVVGYARIGVARTDGAKKGEYSAIYYRTARFTVESSGTFWLSDTPEVPGSTSWGNTIPRICTWGHFIDKATGYGLYLFNVHLDHVSQPSREKGVALMMKRAAARLKAEHPLIVTGDFNAGEENLAIRFMKGEATVDAAPNPLPLVDSFRALYPDETAVRTSAGFGSGATTGAKIDYIFIGPGTTATAAMIDRANVAGRYPSDHYPVTGTLSLPSQ
jgi:endonuclease/exonuclease/phosphatase family metal-dependent hydrolase